MNDSANALTYYLDELYPADVFQLLIAGAETHRGNYMEEIRLIIPDNSIYGTLATLILPTSPSASQETRAIFETLINGYKHIKVREPIRGGHAPEGPLLTLAEGLSRLLFSPLPVGRAVSVADNSNEFLMVVRGVENAAIPQLMNTLTLHATHTRMAGADTADGRCYFFHIKDDPQRRSSFSSLAAGDGVAGYPLLKGYRIGPFTLFLPEEVSPGVLEIDLFCKCIAAAPFLFGRNDPQITRGVLAAVCRWPKGDISLFLLAGLPFYSQTQLTKPPPAYATFQAIDLTHTAISLDGLNATLQTAAPQVAYRLELRTTRHLDNTKAERLYEEKARIEYQLAYLESISRPRPVLYRFTQKQLPALADVIRSFPMKILHEGGLKYGFQANGHDPAGVHYILAEPGEAVMNGLDPLPLWENFDAPPLRFRLDPSWARYYYERGQSLVFVPDGTTLFPVMHDWDRSSMDRYLRETIQQWFQTDTPTTAIPEFPVYIFDGVPQPGSDIRISMLDRHQLKPLHTRLGWLNQNLTVLHAVGIEKLLATIGKTLSWQAIYRQVTKEQTEIRRNFETLLLDSSREIAGTLQTMTATLTDEINSTVEKTFQMVQQIRELDQKLRQWENSCTEINHILNDVHHKQESAIEQTVKTNSEFYTLVRQIDYEIANSQKQREDIEARITQEIDNLNTRYGAIKKKLLTLR